MRILDIFLLGTLSLSACCAWSQNSAAAGSCGDVFNTPGRVGPWSYTDPFNHTRASVQGSRFKSRMDMVESVHFTQVVKSLQRGTTTVEPIGDISYTLEVIPNHHEALYAIVRLHGETNGSLVLDPNNSRGFEPRKRNARCWFERALDFDPQDPVIYMIKGIFHHQNAEYDDAVEAYKAAEEIFERESQTSAELFYNMGLTYLKRGERELAQEYADKAYGLGYPLPGLRELLKR